MIRIIGIKSNLFDWVCNITASIFDSCTSVVTAKHNSLHSLNIEKSAGFEQLGLAEFSLTDHDLVGQTVIFVVSDIRDILLSASVTPEYISDFVRALSRTLSHLDDILQRHSNVISCRMTEDEALDAICSLVVGRSRNEMTRKIHQASFHRREQLPNRLDNEKCLGSAFETLKHFECLYSLRSVRIAEFSDVLFKFHEVSDISGNFGSLVGGARLFSVGPHQHLPQGEWELVLEYEVHNNLSGNKVRFDVWAGLSRSKIIAEGNLKLPASGMATGSLVFYNDTAENLLEFRTFLIEGAIEGELSLPKAKLKRLQ